MSVNYLVEINGLDIWELTHPLPATAYKLMRKLQYLANQEGFPERMTVSNGLLMSMVQCSEDSLIKARNQLIQGKLIEYKGQKKLTPLYMIQYFSHNPVYNSKIAGYGQGIKQGIERGFQQGNGQGTYINKTKDIGIDEDTPATDFQQLDGYRTNGDIPFHRKSYTNPPLLVYPTGRPLPMDKKQLDATFHQRERELSPNELRAWRGIQFFFRTNPEAAKLFEDRQRVLDRIVRSDRFPMELVAEAIYKTEMRNRRYPLDNPVAYLMSLLFDWDERGIRTVQELKESRDDYSGEADEA